MTIESPRNPAPGRIDPDLGVELAVHQQSDGIRAAWQLINSAGCYLLAWVIMYFTVDVSWWLTIPIAVVAAGLLVRVFIVMHDLWAWFFPELTPR